MSDYIKREDAIKGLEMLIEPVERDEHDAVWNNGVEGCINDIKHHTPSADVVEVVRCKDCKYRYLSGVGKQHYVCDFLDAELKENGYCSYGEPKEQEHE